MDARRLWSRALSRWDKLRRPLVSMLDRDDCTCGLRGGNSDTHDCQPVSEVGCQAALGRVWQC